MRGLLTFLTITFAASWALWAGAWLIVSATLADTHIGFGRALLFLPGTVAPAIAAVLVTHRLDGRAAVNALLRRVTQFNVPLRFYLFAVAYTVLVELTTAAAYRAVTGGWPPFGGTSWALMVIAITVSMWVQAGEEIGWRGYALPKLADRFGLPGAGLLLGAIWAAWHLPFFIVPGADTSGQSFPMYLMQVVALSVAMAWLYWRAGGSLLPVMLMHAVVNNARNIVPSPPLDAGNIFALRGTLITWLTTAVMWMIAVVLLARMRGARIGPAERIP